MHTQSDDAPVALLPSLRTLLVTWKSDGHPVHSASDVGCHNPNDSKRVTTVVSSGFSSWSTPTSHIHCCPSPNATKVVRPALDRADQRVSQDVNSPSHRIAGMASRPVTVNIKAHDVCAVGRFGPKALGT